METQAFWIVATRRLSSGRWVDVLECGHVLMTRPTLPSGHPPGVRVCPKCRLAVPPDVRPRPAPGGCPKCGGVASLPGYDAQGRFTGRADPCGFCRAAPAPV